MTLLGGGRYSWVQEVQVCIYGGMYVLYEGFCIIALSGSKLKARSGRVASLYIGNFHNKNIFFNEYISISRF